MCFNKYSMYTFLKENGFRTARSYIDEETFYRDVELGEIRFPVFVKPVKEALVKTSIKQLRVKKLSCYSSVMMA